MLKSTDIEAREENDCFLQEIAPEQSYLIDIPGGWLDDCQEKAGKPDWEITTDMQFQQ